MALWAAGVFSYVSYVWGVDPDEKWTAVSCGSSQGCELLQAVLQWVGVMIHLSSLGLAFVFLASLGNSNFAGRDARSFVAILVAIIAVTICCVLPFFVVRVECETRC